MLTKAGWWHDKKRKGDHDIFKHDNPPPGSHGIVQVPRHTEIRDPTAQNILKDAGLS